MNLNLNQGVVILASKDNVYINNDNRIFYLSDNVDKSSVGIINSSLLNLIHKDDEEEKTRKNFERKPIKLYINSYGGGIYNMWGLVDIIENSKTPIHTYCTGYAMSAAFMIFISGHKRFISKHATLLYHQLSAYTDGTYQDILETSEEYNYCQTEMEAVVRSHTNIKQSKLNTIRKNKIDWYIRANEAIELGIADEII